MKKSIFIFVIATLILTACGASGENAPPDHAESVEQAKSLPTQVPIPGSLESSIPVVVWKGSSGSHSLVPIDPANGEALPGYEPISLGQSFSHAFSPDLRTLAMVGFVSSEYPRGGSLHLIDLRSWEDQVHELRLDGYVNAMSFSPDGKTLGIAYGSAQSQVLVFDLDQRAITGQRSMEFLVYDMKFTSDGGGLMVYGSKIENRFTVNEMSPDPPIAALLDGEDLNLQWTADLEGLRHGVVPKEDDGATADLHQPGAGIYLFPGLSFAPDRDILYIVHPDEDKLTTVNFGGRQVGTVEIQARLSWIEHLLLLTSGVAHAKISEGTSKHATISPDGQFLYIIGKRSELVQISADEWQVNTIPLGLQVVRAGDGSRLAEFQTDASELSVSPDGRYLHLRGWGNEQDSAYTEVFDLSTNEFIERLPGVWLEPTRLMNGAPILASSVWMKGKNEHHNALADSTSLLIEWDSSNYLAWLTTP